MLQNPTDSKHGLSGAFNIVAHFLLSETRSCPGRHDPVLTWFCSFHPAASSQPPLLAPRPLPAPHSGPASGLCPRIAYSLPTASLRQCGFSSASFIPEVPTAPRPMFLTRAPSSAADWTPCLLDVTCFSDSADPNLHSPYPLSQWHHCLPKTNVSIGFSLPCWVQSTLRPVHPFHCSPPPLPLPRPPAIPTLQPGASFMATLIVTYL